MKKIYLIITLLSSFLVLSQAGAPAAPYYNGFNWTLTGTALRDALSTKVISTHTTFLSYTPGVWEASKITDLDPNDATNSTVLLVYGYDNTNICPTSTSDVHRRRSKDSQGGGNSCQWNREHVYAKSLGTPPLQDGGSGATSDAGEDAHHIRPADVDWNGNRADEKFVDATGNSRDITSTTWYPGDEWKGDVARMMMYMYLRYPTQCLPINVGNGTPVATDTNMIDLFLKWNAEDPVTALEDRRNTYHDSNGTYAQGNRNPFIDNPYLATVIWGGPAAENRWPTVFLSTNDFTETSFSLYPNPSNGNFRIEYDSTIGDINLEIYSMVGQKVYEKQNINDNTVSTNGLQSGMYLVKINKDSKSIVKKIVIN